MKNYPLVSVLIPCFNVEKFVEPAVRSIMEQTYKNLEIIVINDCSSDDTAKILRRLVEEDSRIVYIENEENLKLPRTLNKGIALAKGDYIARMDADDISFPQRIMEQISFLLENKSVDLVASNIISIDFNNNIRGYRKQREKVVVFANHNNFIIPIHPTVIFRKTWILKYMYDPIFSRAEDFELWFRAHMNNDFNLAVLPELLLFYREEGNITLDKFINSYHDVVNVRKKYGVYSLKHKIFSTIKEFVVRFLFCMKMESLLIRYRNRKFDASSSDFFQDLVNNFIKYKKFK